MRAAAASRAPRRRPRGPATAAAASSPRASAAARPRLPRRRGVAAVELEVVVDGGRGRRRAGGGRASRRAAGFRAGFGGGASACSPRHDGRVRRAPCFRAAAAPRRPRSTTTPARPACALPACALPAAAERLSVLAPGPPPGAAGALTGAGERAAARAARADAWAARAARPARRAARRAMAPAAAAPFGAGASSGAGGAAAAPASRGRSARPCRAQGPRPARAASCGGRRATGRRRAGVARGDGRARRPRGLAAMRSGATTTVADAERRGRWRRGARLVGAAAGAPHGRAALATRSAASRRWRSRRRGAAAPPRWAPAPAAAARPRPAGFRRGRTWRRRRAGVAAAPADVGVGRVSFVASPPRRSCETRSSNSKPGWMASWRSWPLVMSLTMNGTRHSGHTYSSTVSSRRHAAQNAWPQGSISRSSWSRRSSQRRHVNAASSPAKFSVSPGSIFFPLAARLRNSQGCMRRKSIYSARPAENGAATHAIALAVVYAQTGARSSLFRGVSSSAAADAL